MEREMAKAIELISSLKDGDLVRVTRDGRTDVMAVSGVPRRCDGAFGPVESIRVTVGYGPGRYSTEVSAENLVPTKRGRGYVGGGTKLERVPEDACVSGPSFREHPEHDFPADGAECTRCGAEAEE